MGNDLFAPPSKQELALAQKPSADLFAPPSKEELTGNVPRGTNEEPGIGHKILDGASRVLDYPGGFMRAGLANVAGLLGGKTNVTTPEDLNAAAVGKGPSSSEYLKRLGVGEGPSANLPLLGHTSLRDVEGFGLDVATDPLVAIAKGAKGLGRAAGLIANPAGEAAEKMGASAYKSGFKKIDERLAEKGKTPLSELLLKEGAPTGTTKTVAGKTAQMAQDVSAQRASAYDKINQLAGPVDLENSTFAKAESRIAGLRNSRFSADKALADDLAKTIEELKSSPASVHELSDIKSGLYEKLPDSAYSGGKLRTEAKKFQKDLASDLRTTIIEHGNKAEEGLGNAVDKLNDKWSTLISAEKPTAMQVRRGETPNLATSVDAILAGTGHGAALPIKKAADLAKTTWARTKFGKGLMDLGKSGNAQGLINRELINQEK